MFIPWDCADSFFEAYWRAVHSLRDDLASRRWAERNRELVDLDAAQLGLRPLVT